MGLIIRTCMVLTMVAAGIGLTTKIFKTDKPLVVKDEEETVKNKSIRHPAAVSNVIEKIEQSAVLPQDLNVTSSRADDKNFNQNALISTESNNQSSASDVSSGSESSNSSDAISYAEEGQKNSNRAPTSADSKEQQKSSKKDLPSVLIVSNSPGNNTGTSQLPKGSGPFNGQTPGDNLSCLANVGGGSFRNPIQVSLSCTAAANIKYCIQEGSCCDPKEAGDSYTIPIILGSEGEGGNFCLSFYGENTSSRESNIVEQSYIINNSFPDLQVSFPKIFYQTTQLAGFHFLRSDDFNKTNYTIGEINLRSHDPGPSGLDMDCQNIAENHVTLLAPAPVLFFNPIDMALISFGDQLNVPLVLSKLDYGENFVTSYVVNNNFVAPLYSCSTNKVTLNDFEFFVPEASHGEAGTNAGREFAGSFVAYSFFEDSAQLERAPAGSAKEEEAGQELRIGSFGVFY